MIHFGPLNRSCKLYTRVASPGVGGVVVYTDTLARRFFATLQSPTRFTPDEQQTVVGGRTAGVGMPCYRTRYIPEMATGLIVVTEGRTYRVTRCDPLGRREGWDIYLEDVR